MTTPDKAVRIGTAVSLLTLTVGLLVFGFATMISIWFTMTLATGCFVMAWDRRVSHAHGGPMSLLVITLLAINWPSTLAIWFARTAR